MYYDMNKGVWAPGGIRAVECCKHFVQMLKYEVNILCRTDDSVSKRLKSVVEKWQSEKARDIILKAAASVHPISMSEFDRDPFIFNCTNGTLNFRTWRFTPHNPMDFLTKSANVAYDPKAECSRWRRHMGEVLLERQDLGIYLQKALGYSLAGDTRFECFFVLYGPTGRNGKGVTMSTFAHMLGDYACNANPETLMEKKYSNGSAPSEDLARLAGARYVTFSESEEQKALSSALVKTLTGNDTITARRLYENSFEYKPTYKMFIGTNELPKVTDPVIFTSGRARVIPFDKTFEAWEQDTGLKNELIEPKNLSGILNWCITGLMYLFNKDFGPESFVAPDAVKEAISKYEQVSVAGLAESRPQENDDVLQFMEEVLEASPSSEIRAMSAYGRYCGWCEEKGYAGCSQKMFTQKMGTCAKITRKRPADKSSTNPLSMIIGYKFKSKD